MVRMRFLKTAPLQANPNEVFVNYEDLQNWLRTEKKNMLNSTGSLSAREKNLIVATLETLTDTLADWRYSTDL